MTVENTVFQYRTVVGKLDEMFFEMDLRSEVMLWRADGVGSCRAVDKPFSESYLEGKAKKRLIKLRDEKIKRVDLGYTPSFCPYHSLEKGCVLGNLKSPLCIAHVDYPSELQRRFGINGINLADDILLVLGVILRQDTKMIYKEFGQDLNMNEFVELAVDSIKQMTNHIKRSPILDDSERKIKTKLKIGA